MSVVAPRQSTASITGPVPPTSSARNSVRLRGSVKPKLSRQLQHPHVTLIEFKSARFLITDQPNPSNIQNFILACRLHGVNTLVRVCESTYDETLLEAAGIRVVGLEFEDGAPPPDPIVEHWFQLLGEVWHSHPGCCVAVHCKAGLGRAPALVAAALIELGMQYDEAIELIRSRRDGALNARQIQYLEIFRPRKRLRLKSHADRCWIL
ncbi:unnamed protein product [Dicrocoelium dendriticum]|nr:unnamed protein product [Dicrocoelium dendriticum]